MITPVVCPCCSNELYTTEHIQGLYFGKVGGPKLQQDSKGAFMVCTHCMSRVEFVGTGGQMKVSPIQPCTKLGG